MFKKKFISKKVLKVKVAQKDPLDLSSQKNLPGEQQDQGHGVVLHVQEKFINKKMLLVKVAQNGPLDSSSQKN